MFEFTYGEYPADDHMIGVIMVIISFLPHIVAIYTISVMVYSRCVHHLVFLFGLITSHEIAKLLKRIVKQPRPDGAFLTSYGMPSDHAMFMVFISVYVMLLVFSRDNVKKSSQVLTCLFLCGMTSMVCISRVYLGVHSLEQIVVGVSLGLLWGIFWFRITCTYLLKWKKLSTAFFFIHSFVHDLFLGTHRKKSS